MSDRKSFINKQNKRKDARGLSFARVEALGFAGKVVFTKANIANSEELKKAVSETISSFGGVDLLIANAGVLRAGPL